MLLPVGVALYTSRNVWHCATYWSLMTIGASSLATRTHTHLHLQYTHYHSFNKRSYYSAQSGGGPLWPRSAIAKVRYSQKCPL